VQRLVLLLLVVWVLHLLLPHHHHPGDLEVVLLRLLVYPMPILVWLRLGLESDECSSVVIGWMVTGSWDFPPEGRLLLLTHAQYSFQ